MGFEQVFDNVTFKRVAALRKRFSLPSIIFKQLFLRTCSLKQILAMIVRIRLLWKFFWFALTSMRSMTLYNLLLPRASSFFHYK